MRDVFKSTVLVVLRQSIAAEAARRVLLGTSRFQNVKAVDGGIDAVQFASITTRLDAVIIDEQLTGLSGDRVIAAIRRIHPTVRIVVLSRAVDGTTVINALRVGASALLPATVDDRTLVDTIDRVLTGETPINRQAMADPNVAMHVLSTFRGSQPPSSPEPGDEVFERLTAREIAALDGVVRGMSNREIADRLCVTEQTVKNQMTAVLRKLGADDRVQALLFALQHGWAVAQKREIATVFS
jgi:DNA-binding NarL/FixJ family response regulator